MMMVEKLVLLQSENLLHKSANYSYCYWKGCTAMSITVLFFLAFRYIFLQQLRLTKWTAFRFCITRFVNNYKLDDASYLIMTSYFDIIKILSVDLSIANTIVCFCFMAEAFILLLVPAQNALYC